MTDGTPLGRWIAGTLRLGTLAAVLALGVGLVASILGGDAGRAGRGGARPIGDVVAAGGAEAVLAGGMLTLAGLPLAVLAVTAAGFARAGERRRALTTLVVLALLAASLMAGIALAPSAS